MKQLRKVVIKKKTVPKSAPLLSLGRGLTRRVAGPPGPASGYHGPTISLYDTTRRRRDEKYDAGLATSQNCPAYTDLFGFFSKNDNALDFLIEVAKNHLQTWGSKPPTFMLCNRNLTKGLTMNPEKTKYVTIGPMANRAGSRPRDVVIPRLEFHQHPQVQSQRWNGTARLTAPPHACRPVARFNVLSFMVSTLDCKHASL